MANASLKSSSLAVETGRGERSIAGLRGTLETQAAQDVQGPWRVLRLADLSQMKRIPGDFLNTYGKQKEANTMKVPPFPKDLIKPPGLASGSGAYYLHVTDGEAKMQRAGEGGPRTYDSSPHGI